MTSRLVPPLLRWESQARNGHSPSSAFYKPAIHAQNYNMAFRTREVFSRSWPLSGATTATGTTNLARFRFRSRYGASRLRAYAVIGLTDRYDAVSPRVEIDVTISGGATSTIGPFYYGLTQVAPTDVPSEWITTNGYCAISPATVYECNVKVIDWCRLLAITFVEEVDDLVDPTVNYWNSTSAAVGVPLYDSLRERLLAGSVNMWKQGAGTLVHWAMPDGSARTRTSATLINLIDNATTGSPTTAEPGFYLNNLYRNTVSATEVNYELAVYGQTAAGTAGVCALTDSGGTDQISITNIGTSLAWYTGTGSLPTADTWYSFRFAGDGTNQVSILAVSLIEYSS